MTSEPRSPSGVTRRRPRRATPVAIALGGLLVAVLAIFAWGYYRWVHYDRVAARHLPEGARFIVRVESEQAVTFEPLRRYLFPVLDAAGRPQGQGRRLARLGEATGIQLAMDLREVLLAWGPGDRDWVLVLGGLFPRAGVLNGLKEALTVPPAPAEPCELQGARLRCVGLVWAQAADGCIVVSPQANLLEQALPPSGRYEQLGLAREGILTLWLEAPVADGATVALGGVGRYDEDFTIRLESEPLGDRAPSVAAALEALRTRVAEQLVGGGQPDATGERALLGRATFRAEEGVVRVESLWPLRDYERGARALAAAVQRAASKAYPTVEATQ